ncbi:MAG: serine hydrolase domain-containing protein [Bacteroidota bacterium]
MSFSRLPVGLVAFLLVGLGACSAPRSSAPPAQLDARVEAVMDSFNVTGLGLGRIQDGRLVWTRYYGEQSPGVPVTATTMFNTASMHKAVTAELALRLVDKGLLDLDEPISAHYVHPDIADDPRHEALTPRLLLTHQTGFLNWPFNYEDGVLAFTQDPGTGYTYSGIGFMIFGRFLEQKLGTPYPQLVREHVYDPIRMDGASSVQETWMTDRVAQPTDADGQPFPDFALDEGYWNPADDLYVTVEDYAAFLIDVWRGGGVSPEVGRLRTEVQTPLREDPIWGCDDGAMDPCPEPYGHSIGWFVFGYGDSLNLQHGGNDRGEAANGYIHLDSGNGLVVLVNGANGVLAWPEIVDAIDDEQRFTATFHYIIDKFLSGDAE